MLRLAVIGDLHYEPKDSLSFDSYFEQIRKQKPHVVCQLGDIGGYSYSGSFQSFVDGKSFLSRFEVPYYTLMGNHDLEGEEFSTDEKSIEAWCQVFDYLLPYQQVEMEGYLLVFLSSTAYRSNPNSCHEVYVDDMQFEWLQNVLKNNTDKKILVFSHCPIFASQLKILQNLHLRVPNAYVNHSQSPEKFIELVHQYDNIKLWFSGHNHLGQNYSNSISKVNQCHFVHTAVMGNITRDGFKQSRIVDLNKDSIAIHSLDHYSGNMLLDYEVNLETGKEKRHLVKFEKDKEKFYSPPSFDGSHEKIKFGKSVFIFYRDMLVEFDAKWKTARGVVADNMAGAKLEVLENSLILITKDGFSKILKADKNGFYSKVFFRNPYLKSSPKKKTAS